MNFYPWTAGNDNGDLMVMMLKSSSPPPPLVVSRMHGQEWVFCGFSNWRLLIAEQVPADNFTTAGNLIDVEKGGDKKTNQRNGETLKENAVDASTIDHGQSEWKV